MDRRCDRTGDASTALAYLRDLSGRPIDFGPAQQNAFLEPQPRGPDEGKERQEILGSGGFQTVAFIAHQFPDPFLWLGQEVVPPVRFTVESDFPIPLGSLEHFP